MAIATNEGKYYMYHYDNTMQFEVWRECDVPASLAKKINKELRKIELGYYSIPIYRLSDNR